MRTLLAVFFFGSALTGMASAAFAGPYRSEPDVIPGIGPGDAAAMQGNSQLVYDPSVGYRSAARPAYPRPMAMQPPIRRETRCGGGLIEAIACSGPEPEEAASLPSSPRAYAPSRQAYVAYNATEPQAGGDPNGLYSMRPEKAINPIYQRQEVAFSGNHAPGTIVIDTSEKFLYLVEGGGQAMRYGIGVGRPGFIWSGTKTITRKAEWPDWTPPGEMRLRRPDLPTHMVGGIANPLGARAMYLGSSLYRIHGTNEPETIGTNVSSGCIRLTNEDVSDLYSRVRVGTRVVVM